jgi:hypothetical protein
MNIWKRISLLKPGSITCLLALFRPASCSRNTTRLLAQFTIICMPIVAVYSAHAAGLGQHPPQHHYEVDCQVFYTVPAETYLSLSLDDAIGFMYARTQDVASVITANSVSSITRIGNSYVIDEIIPPGPPRCAEGNSCQLVNGGYYCRSIDCQYMSAHILYSLYGVPVQTRENSRPYMTGYGCALHEWGAQEGGCSIRLSGPGGTDGALADVEPSDVASSKQIDGLRAETLCDGVPTPKDITLTLTAVDNSGGHQHDPGRPTGNLSVTGGTTPLTFAYTSPAVSGDYTITARCTDGMCNEATGFVWVGIRGLQLLQADPSYVRITPNADQNHPSNHYVSGRAQEKIQGLATAYHKRFPIDPLLYLNDASLVRGGVFDLAANWSVQPRGHSTHQRGTDIDVMANEFYHDPAKSIPSYNYVDLMNIVAPRYGCNAQIHSGATPNEHFHLYCR